MTFEEDFPSYITEEMILIMNEIPMDETMLQCYERKDKRRYQAMQKTCLDKQKVREAIRHFKDALNVPQDATVPIKEFEEELGL